MAEKPTFVVKLIRVTFKMLSFLVIDLIVQILNLQIIGLQQHLTPAVVTLIGMGLVVLLFYFLMSYIEDMTTFLLKHVVELGKTIKFKKTAVLIIIFSLYVVSFVVYYRLWFHKWLSIDDLLKLIR